CSVDAGLPATYLRMKRRDYLQRVWINLAEYVDRGARVTLKYIVKDENSSDADLVPFVARAAAVGASDLIVDIDYDFPRPRGAVVAALARLRHKALAAGLHVRYGFTGDNFAPENRVAERVEAAFRDEQLRAVARLVESHGYAPAEGVDRTVAQLVAT